MAKSKAFETKNPLIVEVRERMAHGQEAWREIRDEGTKDMRCVAGDVWHALDPHGARQRDRAKRLMITADELNQYFNQAINGVRANPRAVKFSPIGNGASDRAAEFYADKMREIEYRSHAQIAYITAFENAVQRGYGFVRVNTRWENERSKDQDIWIDAVPNPDMVLVDPDGLRPDASDIKWAIVFETWKQSEFTRQFGEKATTTNLAAYSSEAPQWVTKDDIVVAEYWKIKTRPRKLYLLTSPQGVQTAFADELKESGLPPGFTLGQHLRDVDYPSVCQYLTNGIDILEEKDWAGKYIPIASCYGKILYVDDGGGTKRQILSMTRLAREPYLLYCYYRTTQAELVGMTPKTPYMAYEGQLDATQLKEIARSLHEPVPVILSKPTAERLGPQLLLPHPQRQPYKPEIELLELGAEGARRAIQSAMATNFLPSQAQRRNEKSGRALDKIDEVAQRGSFHFNDHYDDMIRHVGVIVEDLITPIYDTDREVGIRRPNDEAEVIRINAPTVDKKTGKPIEISTKGDYQVTVSTGPAFDSQQEQASELADMLMENEALAARVADIAVRLKAQGPLIDELVERLTPPEFRKDKGGQPDPQQIMQMMQGLQAENQNLKQVASELAQTLKSKQIEVESREKIELAKIESNERIAGVDSSTKLTDTMLKLGSSESIALLKAKLQEAEALIADNEAELSRQHDVALSAVGHADSLEQQAQQHQQALQQGEQGHRQAIEQGREGHVQAIEQIKAQPQPQPGGKA